MLSHRPEWRLDGVLALPPFVLEASFHPAQEK
ncbi:hypothetical protein QFZ30_004317 [Arthrobacter pascens]|nr:hypothetical protein [Arthrobacter pascens]